MPEDNGNSPHIKKTVENIELNQNQRDEKLVELAQNNQRVSVEEKAVDLDFKKKVLDDKRKIVGAKQELVQYQTRVADEMVDRLYGEFVKEEKRRRLFGISRKNITETAFEKAATLSLNYFSRKTDLALEKMDRAEESYYTRVPEEIWI